jgi:poly(A) polymerase
MIPPLCCVAVQSVPDAYVPVIKFSWDGIDFDLVYAQLQYPVIPEPFNIFDDNHLRIDIKSVLSLNGARVTDMILNLVPNIPNFRTTLRFIKLWAKSELLSPSLPPSACCLDGLNFCIVCVCVCLWCGSDRGIYSNVIGYLGGVSWAILVARVCQLYPNAPPSVLLQRFFRFYVLWKWPTPVLLTHMVTDSPLDLPVWNAQVCIPSLLFHLSRSFLSRLSHRKLCVCAATNAQASVRDGYDLVPIITPAYPAINSTHNVSISTKRVYALPPPFASVQVTCL